MDADQFGTLLALTGRGARCLPLASGEVHLWVADPEHIREPACLRQCDALLSDDERMRYRRFAFPRHQQSFLASHALVRMVLSRYAAVEPAAWQFAHNPYGRPTVAVDGAQWLCFNLSHADGLCAVAVVREANIGVDVEAIRLSEPTLDIAARYFAPAEIDALRALPPAEQPAQFFRYWTLKEAYIKARGAGLSLPLHQFAFHLPPGQAVSISFDPQLDDDPDRWRFGLLRPTPWHQLAFAVGVDGSRVGSRAAPVS